MNRQMRMGAALVIASSVAGLVALSHIDKPSSRPAADAPAATATTTPGEAGMRVYLDPETGELTSGPAASAALPLDPATENALRRDAEGLVEVIHPGGAVSVDLQGRFQNVSVVRINDDGTTTICTDDDDAVTSALDGKTPTHLPEVE